MSTSPVTSFYGVVDNFISILSSVRTAEDPSLYQNLGGTVREVVLNQR